MVVSTLLGVWGAIVVRDYDNDLPFLWFGVVGIGAALVGLALLLAKRRVIVDILGGIAFTLLGNILLIYSADLFYRSSFPDYDYSFHLNFIFIFLCTFISILVLLLLGMRFTVHSASIRIGIVVGALIIIVGIGVFLYTYPFIDYHDYEPAPKILPWLSILQILLGIVTIIVPFLKRRRNKQTLQPA
jgi:hypothetical protein